MTVDPSDPEPPADPFGDTELPEELVSGSTLAGGEAGQKARVRAALFHGRPLAPDRIGRFILLGTLGEGGMGTVLEAYDEALDRKIAVKLLHPSVAERSAKRLVREAQALAKLSHPNVVQVYEVGEVEGRTFIAMEMVRGETLQEWQRQAPRPGWRTCVEVYLQAGQGLAAAHAVGLVHRDFKPSNCIIDEQGRVRVLDFGLVREIDATSIDEPSTASLILRPADDAFETSLTRTGTVLGTVAYMPLEQLSGDPADVHSDQFSFCVSLYEAVYGERPFAGDSLGTLARALMDGRVRAAPKTAVVPLRLRRVLVRGLARRRDERWPSMEALLTELRRLLAPRRGRWLALALGVGLTAVGVGLWQRPAVVEQVVTVQERCAGAEARLEGVWDAERKKEVEAAILGTKKSFAPDTWRRVEARLDDYAEAWVNKHAEVCKAAGSVDGPSEGDTAKRYECLSERRSALREAVTVVASVDESTVVKATDVVTDLPRLERCDDLEALRAALPPPEDPAIAEEVEALRGRLVRAKALYKAGAFGEQQAEFAAVLARAEDLGWAPLLAEALTQSASTEYRGASNPGTANRKNMERGYHLALEHGHDAVAALAARELAVIVGYFEGRHEEGLSWGNTALALASRPGAGNDAKAAALLALSAVFFKQENFAEALKHSRAALAIREALLDPHDSLLAETLEGVGSALGNLKTTDKEGKAEALSFLERSLEIRLIVFGPGHPIINESLGNIAVNRMSQGQFDAALESHRRVMDAAKSELGPNHPSVARLLDGIAGILIEQGKLDEALADGRQALAIQETAFGPNHEDVAYALSVISQILFLQGKLDEALETEDRLLAMSASMAGTESPMYAVHLANKGAIFQRQGKPDLALELYRQSLHIKESAWGPKHPMFAVELWQFGMLLRDQGRLDEALETFQRSVTLAESTRGPDHWQVSDPLAAIAQIKLEQRKFEEARALAERAVAILETSGDWPADRAWARFLLARGLWPERAQRTRARALAEQAKDELEQTPEPFPKERLDQVQAWLEKHG